ncbi:LysR substrate-binding domain-containing protein, partial [Pseudomonas viridiflava]|uniref:LysR substrate-binding domain-containing protein n=1 Tax=Pseudomonas viridiflava TaxID=33069 RepID=UPI001F11B109
TRLLLRTTRAISFTAEGQIYLRGARRILADLDEVEDTIADQGVLRGRLRISAALGHGRLAIVPLVAAFSARYPQIIVDLTLSDEVADILGGQADVAVRFGQLPD